MQLGRLGKITTILGAAAIWLSGASVQANPAAALRTALDHRAAGDWQAATQAARGAGPVGRDIIEWHRLRAQEGTFAEARAFLARRPDWPGLPYLIQRSEPSIPEGADAAQVRAFFADQAPRTGTGAIRLADATGGAAGDAIRVDAWTTLSLSLAEEMRLYTEHARVLASHHWARTDMLLWRGLTSEAQRMLPRLAPDRRALAEARIAVREDADGLTAKIEAVPAALAGDPGLAYERFLYRVNRGRIDGAIEILEGQTNLGEPGRWANLRRRYARQLMRDDQNRRAYGLAARHGLTEGSHFADLEWLAGYIALRKLRDADTALRHFERFETAVDTPISLARAAYWQARAHAAVGNDDAARADYARGATHQTAFYGLLSAEAIGAPMDPALTGREDFGDWRGAPFTRSSVFEAALLLLAAGDLSLGERFLTHLAESLDRDQVGKMAAMAREIGEPHLEVMIAKRGVQYGMVIEGPYYALHPLARDTGSVPPELALAIARRESEFDPTVVSGVGARGLMQLMPATAEEMAGDLGLAYSGDRLLTDAGYNARLGLAYLDELQRTFGNSPVQIAASYNAGPSRAFAWMERFGDPRLGGVDIVDWIEHIPFRETRNYVMRVTESLPIYRARLSGQTAPIAFTQELIGSLQPLSPPAPERSLRPLARPAGLPSVPATE